MLRSTHKNRWLIGAAGSLCVSLCGSCQSDSAQQTAVPHGTHRIIIETDNPEAYEVALTVARSALDLADHSLCPHQAQTLRLMDLGFPVPDGARRDNTGPEITALPFVLKGFGPDSEHLDQSDRVRMNSVLQHEIGHHLLSLQFPRTPDSSDLYGSSLPDWIDEMAAILHDAPHDRAMRQFHFRQLQARGDVLAPSDLIRLQRGANPFTVTRGQSTTDRSARGHHTPVPPSPDSLKSIKIQDYYSQVDMFLAFLQSEIDNDQSKADVNPCLLTELVSVTMSEDAPADASTAGYGGEAREGMIGAMTVSDWDKRYRLWLDQTGNLPKNNHTKPTASGSR